MTPTEVTTILRQFNEWRRSDYEPSEQPEPPDPPDPREIGEAIDAAIEMIERAPARITPEQAPDGVHDYCYEAAEGYADGWNACIKTIMEESK